MTVGIGGTFAFLEDAEVEQVGDCKVLSCSDEPGVPCNLQGIFWGPKVSLSSGPRKKRPCFIRVRYSISPNHMPSLSLSW
jgi:hypothetical protein